MIEYAKYYDHFLERWIDVVILQFEDEFAVVRNDSGRYLRIPITELQH